MRRLAVGMAVFSIALMAISPAFADDKDIAREITGRLKQEQDAGNLKGFDINLQVDQGKVLLKGHVASQDQQELALDVARQAEGVQSVVDELEVKQLAPPDDRELATAVARQLSELKADGQMKDFRIGVDVIDGSVNLTGTVASSAQKDLALDVARNTVGVRGVIDQLSVRSLPTVASASDTVAEAEVPVREPQPVAVVSAEPRRARSAPVIEPALAADLTARPATQTVSVLADPSLADSAPVVRRVENALYQPAAKEQTVSDQEIGDQLIQRLQDAKRNGRLRGFGIGVHVNDGLVRLTGRVSSLEQQELALDVAREISGVREIVNEMAIAEPAASAGAEDLQAASLEIAQVLGAQLQRRESMGQLNGCDFDVKVDQAKVRLTGHVASAAQERLVLDVARQIPGVRSVEADLAVGGGQISAMPVSTQLPTYSTSAAMGSGSQPIYPMQAPMAMADQMPRPLGAARMVAYGGAAALAAPVMAINQLGEMGGGAPAHLPGPGQAVVPARYDHPNLPGYAWPSYAAHPNYAAVTYPKQYSPTAWPYIGPFYPYPQVPLGWRKVTLKWDDGWWQLNFKSK